MFEYEYLIFFQNDRTTKPAGGGLFTPGNHQLRILFVKILNFLRKKKLATTTTAATNSFSFAGTGNSSFFLDRFAICDFV